MIGGSGPQGEQPEDLAALDHQTRHLGQLAVKLIESMSLLIIPKHVCWRVTDLVGFCFNVSLAHQVAVMWHGYEELRSLDRSLGSVVVVHLGYHQVIEAVT